MRPRGNRTTLAITTALLAFCAIADIAHAANAPAVDPAARAGRAQRPVVVFILRASPGEIRHGRYSRGADVVSRAQAPKRQRAEQDHRIGEQVEWFHWFRVFHMGSYFAF